MFKRDSWNTALLIFVDGVFSPFCIFVATDKEAKSGIGKSVTSTDHDAKA